MPGPETPLASLLRKRIVASGPIALSDYMDACLLHPAHGYYTTRTPFGAAGDFITAPEISQMFGELTGLCLAQCWLDQGAPTRATLAELGPGRGTLMADLLRATRGVPGFHAAMDVVLVEASPALRAAQAQTLGTHPVRWESSIDALPDAALFLVANEFFDALAIRQFTRSGRGWAETVVGVAGDRLARGRAPPVALRELSHRLADTGDGDVVELRPAAVPVMEAIGARIASHGGAALIVDYGGPRSLGDTFQAVRGHAPADPFAEPGLADLTAHVDFGALADAALPARSTQLTSQGAFLTALGIEARSARLARGLAGDALDAHLSATRRLTGAQEMGTLFKAMALYPPGGPVPPGFDAPNRGA